MFLMKPIPKELFLKHFPNMKVEPGWFGALRFHDPASGLRGHTGRRTIDFKAKDPAIEAAAYLPFTRLAMEAYTSADSVEEDLREDVAEIFAKMWRLKQKWRWRTFWSPFNEKGKKEKRITRERIAWHLDTLGLKSIRRRFPRGYVVTMASGRRIDVLPSRIDFKRSPANPMRGETDRYLAELRLECLHMADSVWHGMHFPGLKGQALLDAASLAQQLGFKVTDVRVFVSRHFGPEATTRFTSRGFIVTVPNQGYVKVENGALEKVCGDLLRPALLMAQELALDEIVVRGKADLVVMAFQEARALGITIVPESDLDVFITILVNVAVIVCMILAFLWLDLLPALLAGYVGGCFLSILLLGLFHKQVRDMARRKGMEMVGLDSAIAVRKASIEEARRNGMI